MNSPQLSVICIIGLIGEENVFNVSPAHSVMLILTKKYLLGQSYFNKKQEGMYKKAFYMLEVLLEVKIYQIISFIP